MNQTKLLFPLIFISLEDEPWEPIEPNAAPAEEPDIEEQDLSQSDWTLASTETVAHQEIDLKNPGPNRGNAGFSDEERGKFTELLQAGFVTGQNLPVNGGFVL